MKPVCILEEVLGGQVLYRAPVYKKILKKAPADKRKDIERKEPGEFNMFGE